MNLVLSDQAVRVNATTLHQSLYLCEHWVFWVDYWCIIPHERGERGMSYIHSSSDDHIKQLSTSPKGSPTLNDVEIETKRRKLNSHTDGVFRNLLPTLDFDGFAESGLINKFTATSKGSRLHYDFISHLPTEISLNILGYLCPRDLSICSQVSRCWRRLSDDAMLWYQICKIENIECNVTLNLHPILSEAVSSYDLGKSPTSRILSHGVFIKNELRSNFHMGLLHGPLAYSSFDQVDWKSFYRQYLQTQCNWRNGGCRNPLILPAHHNHVITCLEVYGDWAITGSDDSSICIWNLATGKCLINLFGHLAGVWSMTIIVPKRSTYRSNNSIPFPLLVSGSCDRTARVWQLDGVRWPCIATLFGHQSTVRCLAAHQSYKGPRFFIHYDAIDSLNAHTTTTKELSTHTSCQKSNSSASFYKTPGEGERMVYSRDELENVNLVVTGSRDTTLRLWDALTGLCLQHFRGHRGAIRCIQFVGYQIVSGSYDCTVRLWCALTGDCVRVFTAHTNRVYTLLFDGAHIISGSLDTTIRVWEASTGKLQQTFYGHHSLTSEMAFGDSPNMLVSSNVDETIRVWHVESGKCLFILAGPHKHQSAVTCVQLTRNFIVSCGDDGTVKLWDKQTGTYIRDLLRLDGAGRGGVLWRIVASEERVVCAAGSRNGMEPTKIIVLHFQEPNMHRTNNLTTTHVCRPKRKRAPCPRLSQLITNSSSEK